MTRPAPRRARRGLRRLLAALALCALGGGIGGCGVDPEAPPVDFADAVVFADGAAASDAGVAPDTPPPALRSLREGEALRVLR